MKSRVCWNALGIAGSLLAGLHTSESDIDLIVYGSRNCRRVYNTLGSLVRDKTSGLKSYKKQHLERLFDFRSKDTRMEFEDFVRTESRKLLQGKFHEIDYFIRCIKAWDEVPEKYGAIQYRSVGEARVRATVIDDSEMIFTPCTYRIDDVKVSGGKYSNSIRELASFRGRFCEQARNGEEIIASGMVESVKKGGDGYLRLLLGNKPSDFMILAR